MIYLTCSHPLRDENLTTFVKHVNKIEDLFWKADGLIEEQIERFVISVGNDDSSDSCNGYGACTSSEIDDCDEDVEGVNFLPQD